MRKIRLFVLFLSAPFAILPMLHAQDAREATAREAILLVAHPVMTDMRFAETVVLVTFPPDTGPMGVVLNKPTAVQLREIWPDRPDRQGRTDIIHYGGPVQPDGLLFVFRMSPPPKKALWITDDIYLSGDSALLDSLLARPKPVPTQRYFAGYAGWAYGQLEDEIAWGGWYVLRIDPDVIFNMNSEDMWQKLLERATLPRASLESITRITEDTGDTEEKQEPRFGNCG